jgi:hypothetical protein
MVRRYSGKDFFESDLDKVREIIQSNPERPRLFLSRAVCEVFNWRKPNGELKEMSCRVAMLRMERDGLIRLPAPRTKNGNGKPYKSRYLEIVECSSVCIGSLSTLKLELVREKQQSYLWNELINRYHYLGFKPLPGAQLRYFIFSGTDIVALLGFGASAWKVGPRDRWIGWNSLQRERNLQLIVNNARFLILPWVFRKNLASKILSLACKRIGDDWNDRYKYRPVLLETFVEERFLGTSYKASNWLNVGETQGRGKADKYHRIKLPTKSIWLYPLSKSFRSQLIQ